MSLTESGERLSEGQPSSPTGVYVTLTRKLRSASKSVGAGGCFFCPVSPSNSSGHTSLLSRYVIYNRKFVFC